MLSLRARRAQKNTKDFTAEVVPTAVQERVRVRVGNFTRTKSGTRSKSIWWA